MKVPTVPEGALEIFLQPGEHYFGGEDTRIRTILGSCVALTLWHATRRIGGMCHFMLPCRNRPRRARLDGKYADEALELLLGEIKGAVSQPGDYVLKAFGGGRMFREHGGPDVAARNAETARELARKSGLHIAAEDLGGEGHRSIIFDIWSGDVWVKHMGLGPNVPDVRRPQHRDQGTHE
jgi:chemotaxis protein CheD